MPKSILGSLWFVLLLNACQIGSSALADKTRSQRIEERQQTESAGAIDTSADLLLGRWVSTKDPDTGFEPWAFFDKEKVYSDGNEEGTSYQLKQDQIIYDSMNGQSVVRVIELTASRFVEESEGGIRTVWNKADF